jgi:type IV pilus assembly protein PilO
MNRKVLGIAGAGILGMVAIWYVMLFSPQGSALSAAHSRLDAARQRQTQLRAQLRAQQTAKTAPSTIQAQIDALKQAIPSTPDLAGFISATNSAASASGIDFVSLAPSLPTASKGAAITELKLSMAVKGTYFQVADFVNRMSSMPRLVVVDGLNLTGDKTGGVSAQINARMFMQPKLVVTTSGSSS